MINEELEAFTTSIQSKLNKDDYALISDDIGLLITNNNKAYEDRVNKASQIKKLESDKEALVIANGNLLQQVPMGVDYENKRNQDPKPEEGTKSFTLKDCFDEKGRFIR